MEKFLKNSIYINIIIINYKFVEGGICVENFLSLSSFSSLWNFINIIIVGIVVFIAINKFNYWMNVIIYAIAKGLIPIITAMIVGSFLGTELTISIGTILGLIILYCISGLIVIKLIEKVADAFDTDTIVYFIIIFGIIDSIVSWLFSFVLTILF